LRAQNLKGLAIGFFYAVRIQRESILIAKNGSEATLQASSPMTYDAFKAGDQPKTGDSPGALQVESSSGASPNAAIWYHSLPSTILKDNVSYTHEGELFCSVSGANFDLTATPSKCLLVIHNAMRLEPARRV
jgi:hypothetical protein